MGRLSTALLAGVALVVTGGAVFAHHSFAMFDTDHPMDLQGADSLLALSHQVDHLKPNAQRVVGILENGFRDDAKTVSVASAAILVLADPVPRLRRQRIHFLALAARAFDAIRPAHITQQRFARRLVAELFHQLSERDVGLSAKRLASFDFLVHEEKYNASNGECQAQHNPLPEREGGPEIGEGAMDVLGLAAA